MAGLAAAGLAAIALEVLRTIAVLRFEARTSVAMQAAVLDRVIGAPARFFRAFSSGDLAMRLGAVNTVQRTVTGASIGAFVAAIFLTTNLALMLAYSPKLSVAAMGIVAVAAILSTVLGIARLSIGRRIEAADGKLSAMSYEYFAGIAKLRAAAAESRAYGNWLTRYRDFRELNRASATLTNLESVLLSILQPAAVTLVLYLAWKLARGPGIARPLGRPVRRIPGRMFGLLAGVQGIVATALDLAALAPAWERARPILATPPEDGVRGKIRHEPQGEIDFVGVSFAYPGGPEVLHGIDLSIRPGEFVAIVGASGSGKSTLLRLLLGFENPVKGTVRFDGRVLQALDLRSLRGRIGTVLQSGRLWAGDIHANIVGASSLTVDDAWEAARAAGLAADIEAMPMGMYTLVGEGVSTLSGGQRQRVLIARALAGRPTHPAARRGDERAGQPVAGGRAREPGEPRGDPRRDRAPPRNGARCRPDRRDGAGPDRPARDVPRTGRRARPLRGDACPPGGAEAAAGGTSSSWCPCWPGDLRARGFGLLALGGDDHLVQFHDLLRLLALGGDGDLLELHDLLTAGHGVELLSESSPSGWDLGFCSLFDMGPPGQLFAGPGPGGCEDNTGATEPIVPAPVGGIPDLFRTRNAEYSALACVRPVSPNWIGACPLLARRRPGPSMPRHWRRPRSSRPA